MDTQRYKEQLLEMESLTEGLEDPEANWLLDWAAGQLDLILENVADAETAGNKANALYAVVRKINRIMAHTDTDQPLDELAGELTALAELAGDAYCRRPDLTPVEAQSAAARLRVLEPAMAVRFLARWARISVNLYE